MQIEWNPDNNRRPKRQQPSDRDSIIASVKHILRSGLYESGDFEVTNKYISIDLTYDSKSYVEFYQRVIAGQYPGLTKIDGTRITVYFGDNNDTG